MEIKQFAYAKAYCRHGFRYYFIHGPLTWFLVIYLSGIITGILRGQPPGLSRLVLMMLVVLCGAILVAKLAFITYQRQIQKWEQGLTENEMKEVQEQLATIRPFFQITAFEIMFITVSIAIRFFLKR